MLVHFFLFCFRKSFGYKVYYFNLFLYVLLLINFTTLIIITQNRHIYRRFTKVNIVGLETNRITSLSNATSASPSPTSDANQTLNQNLSNSTSSSTSNVISILVSKLIRYLMAILSFVFH